MWQLKGKQLIRWILLVVLVVVSIRPVLFTWNFISAAFWVDGDEGRAAGAMVCSLAVKPSVYGIYDEYRPGVIERHQVRRAIYEGDRGYLDEPPRGLESAELKAGYRDNFYVRRLLGELGQDGEFGQWQNLDPVSFEVLADRTINPLTMEILNRIRPELGARFLKNLVDYTFWRGNEELSRGIRSLAIGGGVPGEAVRVFRGSRQAGRVTAEATASVKAYLAKEYRLEAEEIGDNLLDNPGFDAVGANGDKAAQWYFARMAGKKNFAGGSFYMDLDGVGEKGANPVMRIMGFFVSHEEGKSRPRAGVRSRRRIVAENGYYVLSFDIYQETGKERPSFWLTQGLQEKRLRPKPGKWRQVIYILNNSRNRYRYLNPLVRMWGTGTVLVDNVILAKITAPDFNIPEGGVDFGQQEWRP